MEGMANKRPSSVTMIGWLFIIVATCMLISGGMSFMVFISMKLIGVDISQQMPKEMQGPFGFMEIIVKHFSLMLFLEIMFSLFVMISAIQFLRLKAWGRTALEAISWLGLVYLVSLGIIFVFSWIRVVSSVVVVKTAFGPPLIFAMFLLIASIANIAIWGVLLIFIIKLLRGKTIKEAVIRPKNK